MNTTTVQAVDLADTAPPVETVLNWIVEAYYAGAKTYATSRGPDSPERVFWRIRLMAFSDIGSRLADALGCAEPDWEAMREMAEEYAAAQVQTTPKENSHA